jgi:Clp amino terminal domain, pathogenicity island component
MSTRAAPPPNPDSRADEACPYVGTEHLVVAMLWEDYGGGLRRQGISYAQAAEQLASLPRTEQASDEEVIEPLEAVAAPTPAAARLAELARQQAEQHSIDGRISTLHYLLALWGEGGAGKVLSELGITYKALLDQLAAEGTRLIEADDWRPDERPLEGWERFDITPQRWEVDPPPGQGRPGGRGTVAAGRAVRLQLQPGED